MIHVLGETNINVYRS